MFDNLIGVSREKTAKEPMQPKDGCIDDQHFAKQLEPWSDRVRNRDLLEHALEEVAQQCRKCWCEPVVEAGASNSLVDRCGLSSMKPGDGIGFAVDGETHDQCPDEHRDVDCAFALNDIALVHDVLR